MDEVIELQEELFEEFPQESPVSSDFSAGESLDLPAAAAPSQDLVSEIVQSVKDVVQDAVSTDSDPSDDATEIRQDDDTVVDGVMSSYYGGYMSGYLDGIQEDSSEPVSEPAELVDIQTFALSPITSSTGLKGVLLDVLGPYDNVVTQYKYQQQNNSYYTYVNEITPDYPWIGSCLLFTAMVVCIFQLIRRMLGWLS